MRIFIASADKMFRLALQLLLDSEPGMTVAGLSDRAEGLLAVVRASQPEVLLLDCELTKQTTADLVAELHRLERRPKIIALSIKSQAKETILAAGADAFISKNVPPDELLPILRRMRLANTSEAIFI